MPVYRIFDEEESAQGFPLRQLLVNIAAVVGDDALITIYRSEGYGWTVAQWDSILDDVESLECAFSRLLYITRDCEQWFINLTACCSTVHGSIVFGIDDSASLFIATGAKFPAKFDQKFLISFGDARVDPNDPDNSGEDPKN